MCILTKIPKYHTDYTLPGISVEDMMNLHKGKYGSKVPLNIMQDIALKEGYSMEDVAFQEARIQEQHLVENTEIKNKLKLDKNMIVSLQQRGVPWTDDSFKYNYTSVEGKYEFLDDFNGIVLGLVDSRGFVDKIGPDVQSGIIVDKSIFYSEGGGQAADIGYIKTELGSFRVEDVQTFDGYVLHLGNVESGNLEMGETVSQVIDQEHRLGCMRNHTATHLLLAGIRKILDTNTEQAGSSIHKDSFSFDFTSHRKLEADHVSQIEDLVKASIQKNDPVKRERIPRDVALEMEAIVPLRDEIYPSHVYVLSIGNSVCTDDNLMSKELCGGTHVSKTGDIGDLYITSVIRANQATKRIYAVTGQSAKQVLKTGERAQELLQKIKSGINDRDKLDDLLECVEELNSMFGLVMPKTMRDQVYSELSPLSNRLSGLESERLAANAQQVINKEMQAQKNGSFVLCRSDLKKSKQVIKLLLRQTDIDKPLCLVSYLETSVLIAVIGPKHCSSEMKDALNQLIERHGCGSLFTQSKGERQLYSTDFKRELMTTTETDAEKIYEVTRSVLDCVYTTVQQKEH